MRLLDAVRRLREEFDSEREQLLDRVSAAEKAKIEAEEQAEMLEAKVKRLRAHQTELRLEVSALKRRSRLPRRPWGGAPEALRGVCEGRCAEGGHEVWGGVLPVRLRADAADECQDGHAAQDPLQAGDAHGLDSLHQLAKRVPSQAGKDGAARGFHGRAANGIYVESLSERRGDACYVWWNEQGDAYWAPFGEHLRLFVFVPSMLSWRFVASLQDSLDLSVGSHWCRGDETSWHPERGVTRQVLTAGVPMSLFLGMSERLLGFCVIAQFESLICASAVHTSTVAGATACNVFQSGVQIMRALRVENWHLWSKYCSHRQQVKFDLAKYGLAVDAAALRLPAAVVSFELWQGDCDASVGEHFLFHGTVFETAVQIALEGFDFRLSRPGYYGQGTYFASQACKSHKYTADGLRTLIVSRVVVGDFAVAEKVDRECRRPPLRPGTPRCCDSVVAKAGPMPGHSRGEQTHQEFVIFDKFQAYPDSSSNTQSPPESCVARLWVAGLNRVGLG
eukprot:CAMPEP_0175384036 /NCGR_PEP_ID=MMETSP0095-20121207/28134_1 /TAXON_ID=311494 /ORGANISM="Alexandrium monilatum, Strain CCMP3105" /LENGTH=505 /DNA_ID=CAMNT_0016682439 /DNA_START=36 /DNA_END=1551 /DNA_ORIENTATION=+